MHTDYKIRRAESKEDAKRLHDLFQEVFHPEEVGVLAETMFHHLPGMTKKNWFIAEEKASGRVVSAFALIPWAWEMEGVSLKVAEMGIVGTLEAHRGKGLMRLLNREFNNALAEEGYDLAVIQGIPGFYHRFGFHYAVAMENHINLHLSAIEGHIEDSRFEFRRAGAEDIPFMMQEDEAYRGAFSISVKRSEANWRYLFSESLKTEYGSEFWVMTDRERGTSHYFRIALNGFGKGLIVSEVSEGIDENAARELLVFCREKAQERGKPYLRFNLHQASPMGTIARSMGTPEAQPYAWQIKVTDKLAFLKRITPVLENRLAESRFPHYTGTLRLNFFDSGIDLAWQDGKLQDVRPAEGDDCDAMISMTDDLFAMLCLGHRSWQEIRHIRPDIFPDLLYVVPDVCPASGKTARLTDALFPKRKSWVYCQY
ncbi:hypothetical protein DSLASN_42180 [Desulfoluna limicola]|uniref:N-acetyltransferase domain-containing protein n=1 Tax=Desulfoluna limicola TaxID=2810562 RepID=A0ABM7PMV1_9BACT|nr:GNAT family N-acetyltransferase [Desulfoluna limicola]BCS98586.1 hypothetical protein DSLASN_42180 [Desulfoluna limicola]